MIRSVWKRRHPHTSRSIRWWIASARAWVLFVVLLGAVLSVSLLLALLYLLTEVGDVSASTQIHGVGDFLRLWMSCSRAVLGTDTLPIHDGNLGQQALATMASVFGVVAPAIAIAILAVRLYSMRLVVWRDKINVSTMAELKSESDPRFGSSRDGVLSIRFYKKFNLLHFTDLKLEAYLGYRSRSEMDGSTYFRRVRLRVLTPDGREEHERIWPFVETCMPLTLWIPLHARLANGNVVSIQGHDVSSLRACRIFIKAQATIANMNIAMHDNMRYMVPASTQAGRAASVEPDLQQPSRRWKTWPGWDRFDEPATYGIFAYGSLLAPESIAEIVGHPAVEGTDYVRATLRGWKRSWSVCTDNTVAKKVRYVEHGTSRQPPIQILFLNLEHDEASTVEGLIINIAGHRLAALDRREGNYDRVVVTDATTAHSGGRPDVVWAYVGKADRVQRAHRAIAAQTARIREEYLRTIYDAFTRYDGMRERLEEEMKDPPAPIVTLDRVVYPSPDLI
jgi:cation transport regulator ChaC